MDSDQHLSGLQSASFLPRSIKHERKCQGRTFFPQREFQALTNHTTQKMKLATSNAKWKKF